VQQPCSGTLQQASSWQNILRIRLAAALFLLFWQGNRILTAADNLFFVDTN